MTRWRAPTGAAPGHRRGVGDPAGWPPPAPCSGRAPAGRCPAAGQGGAATPPGRCGPWGTPAAPAPAPPAAGERHRPAAPQTPPPNPAASGRDRGRNRPSRRAPRAEAAGDHLGPGHRQGRRPQIGGEQHQPHPATPPLLVAIREGLGAQLAGVKQQGCGIGAEDLRRFAGDGHQRIGDQQAAAGPVQAGHLHEGAEPQIQRAEHLPVQLVGMGQPLLEQHPGAAGGKTKPGQGQRQREAPLARAHPHGGGRKGPRHRRHRQLVLQPGAGGQHDRAHWPVTGFQLAQAVQQLLGGRHRRVEQQPFGEPHHGHADRHRHVEHSLQLLETPDLARHQLPHQGAAVAVGVERQQRPPGPALAQPWRCRWRGLVTLTGAAAPPAHGAARTGN